MITYGPPERRLGPLTSITLPWDVAVYALRQADGQGEVVRRAADSPPGALSLGPFAQHQVCPATRVANIVSLCCLAGLPTVSLCEPPGSDGSRMH